MVLEAVRDMPHLVPNRQPEVMFTEFAESSINFELRLWIPYERQLDYVGAKSEAIMRIKRAFDAAGIVIPFPIRTLDVPEQVLERLRPAHPEPPKSEDNAG